MRSLISKRPSMNIPIYQIDAFTTQVFKGNQAAVCVLESWLDDATLQNIAAENNLAETAFIIKTKGGYDLRWFTPTLEIDLCGHATLASAYVIFKFLEPKLSHVVFSSMSGKLFVSLEESGRLAMDFPARTPTQLPIPAQAENAFGVAPKEVWASDDLMMVFETEEQVLNLTPNMSAISTFTDYFAVIATAKGDKVDFVSRFFAPNAGIPEDPVTGRAHCTLVPYWAEQLNKTKLEAKQLSKRTGHLYCEDKGQRVAIAGYAKLFLKGEIHL